MSSKVYATVILRNTINIYVSESSEYFFLLLDPGLVGLMKVCVSIWSDFLESAC